MARSHEGKAWMQGFVPRERPGASAENSVPDSVRERSAEAGAAFEYQQVLEGIVERLAREDSYAEQVAGSRTKPVPRRFAEKQTLRQTLEENLGRAASPLAEISGPARDALVRMGIPRSWSAEQIAMLKSSIPWALEMYKKSQTQEKFESGMAAAVAEPGAAATNRDLGALIRATEADAGPSPKRSAGYSDARAKFEALFSNPPAESGDAVAAGEHADR